MIERREFITLLGGAAASWPLMARAQQPVMPVVGFLNPNSPDTSTAYVAAFRQGLGETGYVEGRNVGIEYRWAEGRNDRLPALAADLANRHVAVIAAVTGDSAARAAKAATDTIPIVFVSASDPVTGGLVASLSRPGGNLTGASQFGAELMPKRLELLSEIVPNAAPIDVLVNPQGAITAGSTKDVEAAARLLGRQIRLHTASNDGEIDAAFANLPPLRAGALLIMGDSYFSSRIERIASLTLRYMIPSMYSNRNFAAAGGLIGYDTSVPNLVRQIGIYAGRILKGEKPANLPIQQSTKAELIINLKTAKALGLTVPPTLLARADEVIE
jgi:putative tryptophan/tyrosine transport system substrate-binding protein